MSRVDVDQILETFDRAWQRGSRPALANYLLPEGSPERRELTIGLVHIDLEYRLKAGDEAPLVESYLRLYPEAFSDPSEARRLIAAEYQQRWRRESGVRRSDYLLRFPEHAAELAARLKPRWDCPRCRKALEIADESAASATCFHCQNHCPIRPQLVQPEALAPTGATEGPTVRPPAWPNIPGYEILSKLGQGGMGVVYQARQLNLLDRLVALKLVLAGSQARPEDLARFLTEAEAVARLEHPNVVRIYEFGEHQGQPYISLEFAGGGSLDKKLAAKPQPTREAASLVETLARAMHAVHQRGIVHRDLKPANVLLTSDGTPKISDFGLAKRLQDGSGGLTPTAAVLGTPEYMAPEQAAGKSRAIGPAADVYALGAILYEMLTGRPPLRGVTWMDTLQLVLQAEPLPPRRLQPNVQRDLETICMKCLRKEAGQRYASALDLADDLRRFLNGEPIRARPVRLVERGAKWVRRHATATALIIVTLVLAFGALAWEWHARNLQAERQQSAIDAAMAAALKGDLELADKFTRAAEAQGASAGQGHFLRALAYLHKSDDQPAIVHLEQAARLLPKNVAVRALLAIFHDRTGQWDLKEKWTKDMNSLAAVTPEDFLFKGYQESLYDPQGALSTLDKAVTLRDTAVARAIRAEVRSRCALEWTKTSMISMAEDARGDARVARGLLSDNPFALSASARAHLVALILHQEAGETKKGEGALEEMEQDVRALEPYHDYPWVGACRALYFLEKGEDNAAGAALQQAADGPKKYEAICEYATDLYRRGKIAAALAELAKRDPPHDYHGDFLKVFLLAEGENGWANAARALKDWQERYSARDVDLNGAILPLLLGSKQDAKVYADQARAFDPRATAADKVEYYERLRDYASGKNLSPDDLIAAAADIRSRQARAHFLIGMTFLADGKRDDAKRHFQKAKDRRSFLFLPYWMSLAMLARMQQDAAWPTSLAGKK